MKHMKKWLVLFIAFSLFIPLGVYKGIANPADNPERLIDIRIDNPDERVFDEIAKNNITIVEQYPAYVYAKANERQIAHFRKNRIQAVRLPDMNAVFIAGQVIYPMHDDQKSFHLFEIPQGLQAEDLFQHPHQYYLTKFRGPMKYEWVESIVRIGGDIVDHYHYNTAVVRISPAQVADLRQFDFVTAVTDYVPAFKMPPRFSIKDEKIYVMILVWKGVNLDYLKLEIEKKVDGAMSGAFEMPDFSMASVYLNRLNLKDLAAIPDIQYIELPPDKMELKGDVARDIIGLQFIDQGPYPYVAGSYPGKIPPPDSPIRPANVNTGLPVTLNGQGEIIAVFDSGLDRGSFFEPDMIEDFRGGAVFPVAFNYVSGLGTGKSGGGIPGNSYGNTTALRFFSFGFDYTAARREAAPPNSARSFSDIWGHGTHVAAIIAGRGRAGNQYRYRGVAPGARLIIQKITPRWSRDDYDPPPMTTPGTSQPPPRLGKPAKDHPNLTRHGLWDRSPSPDGIDEGFYPYDEVPYKWDLDPVPGPDLPPDDDVEAYISFHDVPHVAGPVWGPEFGGLWRPEDGTNDPFAPTYSGAAGAFFLALTDAYITGARIMNNSWWWYYLRTRQGYTPDPGSPRFNTYDYNMISKMTDAFQFLYHEFLTVWAAGDNGRDRMNTGIIDIGRNINGDYTFGDPWVDGENQQFFAPMGLKNGITVGAVENYRPDINLFYGTPGSSIPRANYGLFYRTDDDLPEFGGFISTDKVSDGNRPPQKRDVEFDTVFFDQRNPLSSYWRDMTKWFHPPPPPDPPLSERFLKETHGKFAMWALSTRGPTSDGRIKPDLVAPGSMIIAPHSAWVSANTSFVGNSITPWPAYPFEWGYPQFYGANDPTPQPAPSGHAYMSGTSMSAAFVSGAAALVRQYYRQVHDLDKEGVPSPSSSLIKATLIHGATNMAADRYPNQYDQIQQGNLIDKQYSDVVSRPDFNQGWGRLNVFKSLFPLAPKVQRWDDNIRGIDEAPIKYKIVVDRTDVPLEVTLVWNDRSANPNSWPVLFYDMDLIVQEPGAQGSIFRGNQFGNLLLDEDPNFSTPNPMETDVLNNVERIVIKQPVKGEYTISIVPVNFPKSIGRQPVPYALVYSGGLRDIPVEHPIPVMNHLGLGLLALIILCAGAFSIRKSLVSQKI